MRIAEKCPAGIITFSEKYLHEHKDDIVNAVKNVETRSRLKNPFGRIMSIVADKAAITVTTTEDKLA
jgi:hypothetical protein